MSHESRIMAAIRDRMQPVLTLAGDCALIAMSCIDHARAQWADRHRPLEGDNVPTPSNTTDRSDR